MLERCRLASHGGGGACGRAGRRDWAAPADRGGAGQHDGGGRADVGGAGERAGRRPWWARRDGRVPAPHWEFAAGHDHGDPTWVAWVGEGAAEAVGGHGGSPASHAELLRWPAVGMRGWLRAHRVGAQLQTAEIKGG
jgi:hypothetical protein